MSVDIERTFEGYLDAVNGNRVRDTAAFFHVPCLLILGNAPAVLTAAPDVLRFCEQLLERFRAAGCRRLGIDGIDTRMMGENLARADVEWTAEGHDGTTVASWPVYYQLIMIDSAWRIASLVRYG